MPPTIKDIAERSGFSTPTVSCILNDKAHLFKPETRRRVLDAAKELGYRPNGLARALRGGRTRTIGFVAGSPYRVSENSHVTAAMVMGGVDQRLWEREYRMLTGFCLHQPERFKQQIADFRMHRVDGLLFYAPTFWGAWAREKSPSDSVPPTMPLVVIDQHMQVADHRGSPTSAQISLDRAAGMARVVDHAWSLGHRRFAYVVSRISSNQDKYDGLTRTLAKHGIPMNAVPVLEKVNNFELAKERAGEILALSPRPTFVICSNDLLALGLIQGLRRQGVQVPRDLSVSGFDDVPAATMAEVPLTTVHQPFQELGQRATDLLLRLIEADASPLASQDRHEVLETTLVVRDSTGPAPPA